VKSGTTIASSTYTYDNLGRKLSDAGIGYTSSYAYDSAGQLVTENRTGSSPFTSSYSYDLAGNRLTKVLNGVTESYTYDNANKLLTAGSKVYAYDNAGNTTSVTWSGGSRTLSWDAESRLKSSTSAGFTVNYSYNGIGQRVTKSGAATATYVLGDDSIDAEVLSDGSATYAHGVAGLVSENRGGVSKVYHSDALGSVRALTNTSGTVTDTRSRDAFGNVTTTTGTTPTAFGFVGGLGYQQDAETGLMRLGHRMYDSSMGRFISRDPIQYGYNWYGYCDSDSVNAVDNTGLLPKPIKDKIRDAVWDAVVTVQVGLALIGIGSGKPTKMKPIPRRPTPISAKKPRKGKPGSDGNSTGAGGGLGSSIIEMISDGKPESFPGESIIRPIFQGPMGPIEDVVHLIGKPISDFIDDTVAGKKPK
jgi:RHS repeat-associated protein